MGNNPPVLQALLLSSVSTRAVLQTVYHPPVLTLVVHPSPMEFPVVHSSPLVILAVQTSPMVFWAIQSSPSSRSSKHPPMVILAVPPSTNGASSCPSLSNVFQLFNHPPVVAPDVQPLANGVPSYPTIHQWCSQMSNHSMGSQMSNQPPMVTLGAQPTTMVYQVYNYSPKVILAVQSFTNGVHNYPNNL